MINIKYTKNIDGKFGFYANGGLVGEGYIVETFNSLVYSSEKLEQQLAECNEAHDKQGLLLAKAEGVIRASIAVAEIANEYVVARRVKNYITKIEEYFKEKGEK